jgi:aspartyl-tRNA(Asn)/glutamyl-tRNA(Gln) amidotransferase subunit A
MDVATNWLTIREAGELLGRRELSAVELVEGVLEQMSVTEPGVHAYCEVAPDGALEAAEAADRELREIGRRSPLHGVPVAIKDVIDVRGFHTKAGSRAITGSAVTQDAVVVDRLRRAGAIIVGKTVTHEFAYGQDLPPTRNAWDPARAPGGSSAGSAASVAVGSSLAAVGTDSGGSIRIPAALNGVVGLKPTFGRVSRDGVIPLSPTLDAVGPLARTAEDCALMLQAMAGFTTDDPTTLSEPVPDYLPPASSDLRGLVVGVEREYFFDDGVADDVRGATEAAISQLESQGARIVDVEIDSLDYASTAGWTIVLADAADWHRRLLRRHGKDYVTGTKVLLELGALIPAAAYVRAQNVRRVVQQSTRRVFEENNLDALAAPATPFTAGYVDDAERPLLDPTESPLWGFWHHAIVANLIGLPSISLPCGVDSAHLPVGMQLLGRPFGERTLLRVGHAYQLTTDWHTLRPPWLGTP